MTSYLFVLGRTPKLAFAELQAFFPQITLINPNVAKLEVPEKSFSPEKFNQILGGTIKIAKVIAEAETLTPETLGANLTKTSEAGHRINFGMSSYETNFPVTLKLLSEIKQFLEKQGFSARFIAPPKTEPLSSVVVAKQAVNELILVKEAGQFLIGKTVAVQPFEDWNKRDYGRPYADPRAGMLPPKVCRMAVNLALGSLPDGQVLLDPFCGMGTILAEAMLSGVSVIGSDQNQESLDKAQKNLIWLVTNYPKLTSFQFRFFVSEATHVSEYLSGSSVDAVVTEPFMGSPNLKIENIPNVIKGLEKLYIGCLRDWQKVLKPEGRVVIALPKYAISGKTYFVKKVIDMSADLGYTVRTGPIEYSRPQAVVKREFFVFTKN